MGMKSSIEWTEATWNPVTGCTKTSAGCANCYAKRIARRLQAMGQPNYANGFELTLHEKALCLPLKWKTPQRVFVNSMSDLFHDRVPEEFILRVFEIMGRASWHQYQILTKRSGRLRELDPSLPWEPNIWMGVSVESQEYVTRIDDLRSTHAALKFVSFEPLLGPVSNLDLTGISWAIVGGESGPKARPMRKEWVTQIRDSCRESGVAFFFKQWGGVNKKANGRRLDGQTWDDMPPAANELSLQLPLA